MPNRLLRNIPRDQRGITGLETAIILIAFVVVASVFAYTVLSAGISSAEKGKEAVYSGLESARSSMILVGEVKAIADTATELDDADTAWTASANVTATIDTVDRKEGTGSADLLVDGLFATGLVAYKDPAAAVDLSGHYTARLWIKSTLALNAGDLQLLLDDTAACVSALESLDIPALAANTWTRVQIKLVDPSLLTAVACVGINAVVDPGATTINVDLVESPGEVDQVVFMLANAQEGAAIDLTSTTDADGDGLLSDETRLHSLVIDFVDSDERVADITWTKTQRGKGDGDDLLEAGEKFEIVVNLKALSTLPVERSKFDLHLRPASGSSITIEKSIPGTIDTVMVLN